MLQIRMLLQEIIRLLQRIRKAYTNVVSGVARIQMIVIGRTHLVSLDIGTIHTLLYYRLLQLHTYRYQRRFWTDLCFRPIPSYTTGYSCSFN